MDSQSGPPQPPNPKKPPATSTNPPDSQDPATPPTPEPHQEPQQPPQGYPPQPQPQPGAYPPQPGAYPPQQRPGPYPAPQQPGQPPFWSPEQPSPWGGQQPAPPLAPYGQPPYGPSPYGPPPYGAMPAPYGMRAVEPKIVPAPPGTPYHRLARTAKHRWWRPIAGTAFLVAVAFLLTGVVLVGWEIAHALIAGDFSEPQGNNIFPSDLENLAVTLVLLGILTPVVLLSAWVIQRRPALSVASVLNRVRWRWLLLCCLPGLGYLVLSYGLGLVVDQFFPTADAGTSNSGSWVGLSNFLLPALVILALVPFQSAAEEFVFRGWVVQAIGAYGPDNTNGNGFVRAIKLVLRSPWPALLVSSALFVSAHGYTGWAMADIFLFAMTIGWLTIRTGGLEAGIALHALNNLLAFLLPAAMGQLSGWDNQGGAPWTLLVADIPCLAFYAFAVVWLAKRKQIRNVS